MFSQVNQCKTEYDDAGPCPPLRSFILLPLHCIGVRRGRHWRPTSSGNSSETGPQMDLCARRAGPQRMNEPQTDFRPRKRFVTTPVAREGCVRGVPPLTDLRHFAPRGGRSIEQVKAPSTTAFTLAQSRRFLSEDRLCKVSSTSNRRA